jgi:predicted RNA-binding protein with PUA-like domain
VKTIGDIERWLKRDADQNASVTIYFDPKSKTSRFAVHTLNIKAVSSTLEGALENALEELRRKENGAESMRSEKTTRDVPVTVTVSRPSLYIQDGAAAPLCCLRPQRIRHLPS